jgi:hypothetical protein
MRVQNDDGMTPMHSVLMLDHASGKECIGVVSELLTYNAKPNAVDKHGENALHMAVERSLVRGGFHVTQLLLWFDADVNCQNRLGNTPLHNSVQYPEIVAVLLDAGADVNLRNVAGQTAEEMCAADMKENYQAVVPLLQARAADDSDTKRATITDTTTLRALMQSAEEASADLLFLSSLPGQSDDATADVLLLSSTPGESDDPIVTSGEALQLTGGSTKRRADGLGGGHAQTKRSKSTTVSGSQVPQTKDPVVMIEDEDDGDDDGGDDGAMVVKQSFPGVKATPTTIGKSTNRPKRRSRKISRTCVQPRCNADYVASTWSKCATCDGDMCHNHGLDHGPKCKRLSKKRKSNK